MRIKSSSEALAVRSKNVGIGGSFEAPGNARSTTSPSSADARARVTSSAGAGPGAGNAETHALTEPRRAPRARNQLGRVGPGGGGPRHAHATTREHSQVESR